MKRSIILLLMLFCYLTPSLWAASTPMLEVRDLVDSVQQTLEQTELPYADKRQRISALVQGHIDMVSISRRILGVHWRNATVQQRDRFSELFVQVMEATYLHRIKDYSGGRVEYLQERIKEVKAIVDVRFISEKVQVPVRYKLLLNNDRWRIYDIVIEKVSLVRNFRSSYGEIISKEGFDGLFARLEKKIVELNAADQ